MRQLKKIETHLDLRHIYLHSSRWDVSAVSGVYLAPVAMALILANAFDWIRDPMC